MIKILFWLFRERFLKLAFDKQSRKKGFEGMQKIFIDSNGKFYYSMIDDLDLPIVRGKEVQKRIMLIQACISEPNMSMFLDAMEAALNNGKKPDIAEIGFLVKELRKRMGIWVDMDLLFDTVALSYIREDEKVEVIDSVIHKEKVEQFKKDSEGGLYDFFYKANLVQFVPFLGKSQAEWDEYFRSSELKMKAIQKLLKNYTTA